MSREIKFRGHTIPFKEKDYEYLGEWVYGYFHKTYSEEYYIIRKSKTGLVLPGSKVSIESVGQFTGLKDENGVDIYEFDIVTRKETGCEGSYISKYKVIYKENSFVLEVLQSHIFKAGATISHMEGCTVIGNSFENPELL